MLAVLSAEGEQNMLMSRWDSEIVFFLFELPKDGIQNYKCSKVQYTVGFVLLKFGHKMDSISISLSFSLSLTRTHAHTHSVINAHT